MMDGSAKPDSFAEALESSGYVVIDDFLREADAIKLSDRFESADWDQRHDQVRENHFKHVFKTDSERLPSGDEIYLARFNRSTELENDSRVRDVVNGDIKRALEDMSGEAIDDFDYRCMRMASGDFMRVHIDDYAGKFGFILYLHKDWKWDWGGILSIASGDDLEVEFPMFNRLVVLAHERFRAPHFISTVTEFAKSGRYFMIGFSQS